MQQNDDGDEEDVGGGPGNWQVGDYWQYTQTETGMGIYSGLDQTIYVERYEVVQVNVTNITIAMERDTYSYNHTHPAGSIPTIKARTTSFQRTGRFGGSNIMNS